MENHEYIIKAHELYMLLLKKTYLKDSSQGQNKTLYNLFLEEEVVREYLIDFANEDGFDIAHINKCIYLIPKWNSPSVYMSPADIRKQVLCADYQNCKDNALYYCLAMFVILSFLSEFFKGNKKTRSSLLINDFLNSISERLKQGISSTSEISYSEINYKALSDLYEGMVGENEKTDGKCKTKYDFVFRILRFLYRQELLVFNSDEGIIYVTKKLEDIMELKFLNNIEFENFMNITREIDYEQN